MIVARSARAENDSRAKRSTVSGLNTPRYSSVRRRIPPESCASMASS
jgi:hypothetical protein